VSAHWCLTCLVLALRRLFGLTQEYYQVEDTTGEHDCEDPTEEREEDADEEEQQDAGSGGGGGGAPAAGTATPGGFGGGAAAAAIATAGETPVTAAGATPHATPNPDAHAAMSDLPL